MPPKAKSNAPGTVTWAGDNAAEVIDFCGLDRLQQPRANIAHFWDGSPLLTVWTLLSAPGSETPKETTLPVRVGETIARDDAGNLSVVGVDTSTYE